MKFYRRLYGGEHDLFAHHKAKSVKFRDFAELDHKIPKISPGAYIFQRPFLRSLFLEGLIYGGKFVFKIDWASLIVGSKFTVFALFHFVFEGNFPSTSPWGAYIWRGD